VDVLKQAQCQQTSEPSSETKIVSRKESFETPIEEGLSFLEELLQPSDTSKDPFGAFEDVFENQEFGSWEGQNNQLDELALPF